jgi:4'-phosphopantetheinyl transferase
MPTIAPGEVHVWTARPSSEGVSLVALEALLNPQEKSAAYRFVFERHRLNYIFAHGVLRQILGAYIDRPPGEIQFRHNAYGKPFLLEAGERERTQFNMSHSHGIVLVALTLDRRIGADVEQLRTLDSFPAIAQSNFTTQERAYISGFPPEQQQDAFYKCWTRKEAFIKAVGKGLSIPLNTFDASIPEGQPGRRITAPKEAPDVESWWLSDLSAPEGYAGAVAVEQQFDRLVYREWRPS